MTQHIQIERGCRVATHTLCVGRGCVGTTQEAEANERSLGNRCGITIVQIRGVANALTLATAEPAAMETLGGDELPQGPRQDSQDFQDAESQTQMESSDSQVASVNVQDSGETESETHAQDQDPQNLALSEPTLDQVLELPSSSKPAMCAAEAWSDVVDQESGKDDSEEVGTIDAFQAAPKVQEADLSTNATIETTAGETVPPPMSPSPAGSGTEDDALSLSTSAENEQPSKSSGGETEDKAAAMSEESADTALRPSPDEVQEPRPEPSQEQASVPRTGSGSENVDGNTGNHISEEELDAMYEEASSYMTMSNGKPKDAQKALKLYQKAADAGSLKAKVALADLLCNGNETVAAHPVQALRLYEVGVAEGDIRAIHGLATLLSDDTSGVDKDQDRALRLYERAAEAQDADSKFALSKMLWKRRRGPNNEAARAVNLLEELVAETNRLDAKLLLADYLTQGAEGVPMNAQRARTLLESAAETGNISAVAKLGILLSHGSKGIPAYPRRAKGLLERAAAAGDVSAKGALARLLMSGGQGVRQDLPRAAQLLRNAIDENGSEVASWAPAMLSRVNSRINRTF